MPVARKLGLDAQPLFDISSKASGQCWSMTSYSPNPARGSRSTILRRPDKDGHGGRDFSAAMKRIMGEI